MWISKKAEQAPKSGLGAKRAEQAAYQVDLGDQLGLKKSAVGISITVVKEFEELCPLPGGDIWNS